MNAKTKKRLMRICNLFDAVPFGASGTKSQTIAGVVAFEEDMRAFRPALKDVINGMILETAPAEAEIKEGIDYQNPDLLLSALEAWIEKRKAEDWQKPNSWGFRVFYEQFKARTATGRGE